MNSLTSFSQENAQPDALASAVASLVDAPAKRCPECGGTAFWVAGVDAERIQDGGLPRCEACDDPAAGNDAIAARLRADRVNGRLRYRAEGSNAGESTLEGKDGESRESEDSAFGGDTRLSLIAAAGDGWDAEGRPVAEACSASAASSATAPSTPGGNAAGVSAAASIAFASLYIDPFHLDPTMRLPKGWRPDVHFRDHRPKRPFPAATPWCEPYGHRRGWRSVNGPHVICGECHPPASEAVVAEWVGED